MERKEIFFGANVDEAIAAGLSALGLPRERVQIEVLDEGSPGFLGLGARPARVRVIPIAPPEPEVASAPAEVEPEPAPTEEPDLEGIARSVAGELLERLGIEAEVRTRQAEAETEGEVPPLILDIRGEKAEVLIGRRGETLAAFQHIVRLLVGRRMVGRFNLVVDVNGYKRQRERSLRRLARRMAEKAVRTGRTVRLEPMPAYERRIVHLALRDHPDVTTESIGEGKRRRVTIIPRKE
ncbi:MAG TPA: protein jag [Chloroflexi bacterium]|nr:protein jag [Chloroflexota bacterium]